jgi:hypothetical protein
MMFFRNENFLILALAITSLTLTEIDATNGRNKHDESIPQDIEVLKFAVFLFH